MALGCRVDTIHPVDLQGVAEFPFYVKNSGKQTVYYKQGANGASVTPTNKDGEILEGKEFLVTQPTWVIAKEPGAQLDFRVPPRITYGESAARTEEESRINVRAAPYNATGNGVTDDTAAIQAAITAGKEKEIYIPAGKYQITSPLEVPVSTVIRGANSRTCVLEAEGEIDLFRFTSAGDNVLSGMFLRCKTAQASAGSALDFSHGFVTGFYGTEIRIGSNFFNGIYCVGTGSTEISFIKFDKLYFAEPATGVKSIKNAAVVLGASANRCTNPAFQNVTVQSATVADVPKAFEINNTDSLMLTNVLLQTCEKGVVVGNSDSSTKLSTNLMFNQVQADGCTTAGFELAKMFDATLSNCRAEAGGAGLILGTEASGNAITGSAFYTNNGHGIELKNTVSSTYSNTITGCSILNNGQDKAAGRAGISIPDKVAAAIGGLTVTGCTIGNSPIGLSTEEQKIGIALGKECENVGIFANRFVKNVTEVFKKGTGEVKVNNETEAAKIKESLEKNNQIT